MIHQHTLFHINEFIVFSRKILNLIGREMLETYVLLYLTNTCFPFKVSELQLSKGQS